MARLISIIFAVLITVLSAGLPLFHHICHSHGHEQIGFFESPGCGDEGKSCCPTSSSAKSYCHSEPDEPTACGLNGTCCQEEYAFLHLNSIWLLPQVKPLPQLEALVFAGMEDLLPRLSQDSRSVEPFFSDGPPPEDPVSLSILHCCFRT